MLTLLRADDKLLHGQVAFSWVRNLKIQMVLIADDHIAHDEFMKMTLGLSKPSGVHLQILEIDEAIAYLKENLNSPMHIMAIVNSIENSYRIIKQIPQISSLNLGSLRERYDTKIISESVALRDDEINLCKALLDEGKEIEIRMRYDDNKVLLNTLLEND